MNQKQSIELPSWGAQEYVAYKAAYEDLITKLRQLKNDHKALKIMDFDRVFMRLLNDREIKASKLGIRP